MKFAICDDAPEFVRQAAALFEERLRQKPEQPFEIEAFSSGNASFYAGKYDLVFLDVSICPA